LEHGTANGWKTARLFDQMVAGLIKEGRERERMQEK